MDISRYLREKQVCLELKATEKKAAIKELAGYLRRAREITNFGTFLKDVFERESLGTTGIGYEIAIPHTRTDAVKNVVIAFGRSQEGVEFDSLDGKPVKLIFLIGTPKKKELSEYLKILAHLSRLLKKKAFRRLLMKAPNAKVVIEIFKKVED